MHRSLRIIVTAAALFLLLAPGWGQGRQPAGEDEGARQTQTEGQKIKNAVAVFTGLDKITGRTITFDVWVNETVQFGALQVTPRTCHTRPATEAPNTTAFLEVDEITLQNEIKRLFTGWTFASSPGLHAVEHPIYDVWLIDCRTSSKVPAPAKP